MNKKRIVQRIPETGTPCDWHESIPGTNAIEWKCPKCQRIWTAARQAVCDCKSVNEVPADHPGKWSVVPFPLNAADQGPVSDAETVTTSWQVWCELLDTVCECRDKATAEMIANEHNAIREAIVILESSNKLSAAFQEKMRRFNYAVSWAYTIVFALGIAVIVALVIGSEWK